MKKFKFIIKPPVKKEFQKEIVKFKKKFEVKEELTEKEGQRNAKNLAKSTIKEKFNRIIVVGGDGLLHQVLNGIMTEKIPEDFAVGIVPTGAGNNFAKEIGIPKDIKKAFNIIEKGKEIFVDVGKVNDKFFINCFSLGFDAKINDLANKIKEKYSFLPRNLSYLFAALKEIVVKIPDYEIEIKGLEINYQGKIVLIAITNSQSYGAIFKINPGASVSDGKFNLCLIEPVGKIKALKDLFLATKGSHIKMPETKNFLFSLPLKIFSKEPLIYEMDGEVFEPENEFKVEIFPKKIKFLVP
jgi:YegS/Rv2252/BmrU family lipid kinase